jgi:hypothetical protein
MQPGIYNWTIYQGTSDSLVFTVTDNNVPRDLTGYEVRMQIRKNFDQSTAYLTFTSNDGSIVVTPLDGKVEVLIPPDATSSIPFKGDSLDCVYDIELVTPSQEVIRILMGDVAISREVTRD